MLGGTEVAAMLVLWSIVGLDVKWSRLLEAPRDLYRIFELMFTQMNWNDFTKAFNGMWTAIAIAWLGTMIAGCSAAPFGFLAAENLVPRWFSFGMRQIFNLLRSVPELVIVLALIPVLGFSKSAGVLALAIGSIGTLSKLCSEVIEGIDRGPIEATDACGANALQRLRWAVIPQAAPEIVSFVLYRFEINIRVSAILGVLGIPSIGGLLRDGIRFKEWGQAGAALIVIVTGTILIDLLSGAVRRRILSGPRGAPRHDDIAPERVAELMAAGSGPAATR
ncbi:MAG: phosphonate ABC transporter, permease protein PhnE [Aldersonia sp.]|nr:phosphonate ABC transporter, permease protein PhnE [Aldersonia sp.]